MKVPVFQDPILTQYLTDLAKEREETDRDFLTKGSANHSLLLQSPSNSIYEVLVNDLGVVNTNLVLFSTGTPALGLAVTENRDTAAFFGQLPNAPGIHWNYLSGLTLSTAGSSATFTVAPGVAVDSTNADLMRLTTAMSKTTGAWAAGSGSGGLDTGVTSGSAWYHVWMIKRPDTGAVDILFSLSATAPILPANYKLLRRIGSMNSTVGPTWSRYIQLGDEFLWVTPNNDIDTSTLGTTPTLFQLFVPPGVQVIARIKGFIVQAAINTLVLVNSPDEGAFSVNSPQGNFTADNPIANSAAGAIFTIDVRTNTASQVRAVSSIASTRLVLMTYGYIDRRGRDG